MKVARRSAARRRRRILAHRIRRERRRHDGRSLARRSRSRLDARGRVDRVHPQRAAARGVRFGLGLPAALRASPRPRRWAASRAPIDPAPAARAAAGVDRLGLVVVEALAAEEPRGVTADGARRAEGVLRAARRTIRPHGRDQHRRHGGRRGGRTSSGKFLDGRADGRCLAPVPRKAAPRRSAARGRRVIVVLRHAELVYRTGEAPRAPRNRRPRHDGPKTMSAPAHTTLDVMGMTDHSPADELGTTPRPGCCVRRPGLHGSRPFLHGPGEVYCGAVTLGGSFRTGLSPRVQMRLTLDASMLDGPGSPGTISTFEALGPQPPAAAAHRRRDPPRARDGSRSALAPRPRRHPPPQLDLRGHAGGSRGRVAGRRALAPRRRHRRGAPPPPRQGAAGRRGRGRGRRPIFGIFSLTKQAGTCGF